MRPNSQSQIIISKESELALNTVPQVSNFPSYNLSCLILLQSAVPPGYLGCSKGFKRGREQIGKFNRYAIEPSFSKSHLMDFNGCLETCRAIDQMEKFAYSKTSRECICTKDNIDTGIMHSYQQQVKKCRDNHKFQYFKMNSYSISSSCGDLYFKKEIYLPNIYKVNMWPYFETVK